VLFNFVRAEMAADVLTKALPKPRHDAVVRMLGVGTLQSSLSGSVDRCEGEHSPTTAEQ
jgi:hypothetical protein